MPGLHASARLGVGYRLAQMQIIELVPHQLDANSFAVYTGRRLCIRDSGLAINSIAVRLK